MTITPPPPNSASWTVKLAGRMMPPMVRSSCFEMRRPLLLLLFHADCFRWWRSDGRGVESDQDTIEPIGAMKTRCAVMEILPESEGGKQDRRRCSPSAAVGHSEGKQGGYSAAIP